MHYEKVLTNEISQESDKNIKFPRLEQSHGIVIVMYLFLF